MENTGYIFVKADKVITKVMLKDILYVRALKDYVEIIQATKTKIVIHYTMTDFKSKLPKQFVRVHRSFIVNMDHCYKIEDESIEFTGYQTIPIGPDYKKELDRKSVV